MPLLIALAAIAGGIVLAHDIYKRYENYEHERCENYKRNSPHYAPTSKSVQAGQSYVLTLCLTSPTAASPTPRPPPSIADAKEVAEDLGLHPFSVTADAKDPQSFALVAGFTGQIHGRAVKDAILPSVSEFTSAKGVTWNVSLPQDPVSYHAATQTPAGAVAAAKAPSVEQILSQNTSMMSGSAGDPMHAPVLDLTGSFLGKFVKTLGRAVEDVATLGGRAVEDVATLGGAEVARKLENDAWAGKHTHFLLSKLSKGERADVAHRLEDTRRYASPRAKANLDHAMAKARMDGAPHADELERLWHGQGHRSLGLSPRGRRPASPV